MAAERIIEQILSMHPEVSKKEILERLEKEKRKTGGLISDESLLRMLATDLGVKVSIKTPSPTLSIEDLVPGLSDVTVVGRVIAVFPPKTFKGNKIGKFASLLITDKKDSLRVVLWNDKASYMESGELKVGRIVRFSHGYTRENRGGRVELHIGDRGEIKINPQDVEAKDYPDISKFALEIGKITQSYKNKRVNVIGMVKAIFEVSTFKRQDSSSGKVLRFILGDEMGQMPVVVWNDKVDELEKMLKMDVKLQIVNAKVKKSVSEGLEIHADAETYFGVCAISEEYFKIADLKEGLNRVNIEGEVLTKPMFRDVKTSRGDIVKLAVFELKDETSRIWVSAWRKHADLVKGLMVGDKVVIKNAHVKKGFGDSLELSTKNVTAITFLSKS